MKKKIQKIAKDVIQFEIQALQNLKKNVGNKFNEILKIILNCKEGKVIISGVGKVVLSEKMGGYFFFNGYSCLLYGCI